MNTKLAISALGGIVAGLVLFGVVRSIAPSAGVFTSVSPVGTSSAATSSDSVSAAAPPSSKKSSSEPTITFGKPTTVIAPAYVSFDELSFTSRSHYPVITGTSNLPKVTVIIYNSRGTGLVGSSEIIVHNTHWSYASPVALPTGSYTVKLPVSGETTKTATLTVQAS